MVVMPMLNLAKLRAGIAALPGNRITATKAQIETLIQAAERGQAAERKLEELKKSGTVLVAA
jgi:hypothetical protein